MKIRIMKNSFSFKLEQTDFEFYGFLTCKSFLNAIRKEIPATKRSYIKKAKLWIISNDFKAKFTKLNQIYFGNDQIQMELWNE